MKKTNSIKGKIGEENVDVFLKQNGYKILQRNYRNKMGEIDIICLKKKVIVFVEVKARSTFAFGRPCEAVTPYKQMKIRRVSELYLIENKIKETDLEFVVVEVFDGKIKLIDNAF